MPVRLRLESPPRFNDGIIVTRSAHKLQPDREILSRESAGNGHRRKPADIADAAERIGKSEIGLEIHG